MLLVSIKVIYTIIHFIIGVYDFSFYRIPNILLGTLLALYTIYAPFYVAVGDILNSLIVFGIVLTIGFGLFAMKYIGGGDAKYLATVSLWVGAPGIIKFSIIVALIGGVLGLIYVFLRDPLMKVSDWAWTRIQMAESRCPILQKVWIGSGTGFEAGKRENIDSRTVPYGIAIASAAIIWLVVNPLTN